MIQGGPIKGKFLVGTDASGGRFPNDPRKRRVGWGVGVKDADLETIGTLRGGLPGKQTINRGELYAVIVAVQNLAGELTIVTDSAYVYQGVLRGPQWRHRFNVDLWQEFWEAHRGFDGTMEFHKTKSHPTESDFWDYNIQPWAYLANQLADKIAGDAAE